MTENTGTPITQAQVDFVKKTMSERGLDVSTIPNPNEGETVEEWFDRSIAQYNEIAQNNDWGEHAYLYSSMNYVADSANLSASFLSTMKPFVVNDFASMSDEEQVVFLHQYIDENIKPEEHGVKPFNPLYTDGGNNLDKTTDAYIQDMSDESVKYSDFSYDFNTGVGWANDALSVEAKSHVSFFMSAGVPAEKTLQITGLDLDDDKYNDRMKTQRLCAMSCDIAKASRDFPKYEEPVAEKPLGMATTSKDHRVRIDQWMEHLGKADQAQALVDKYGLEVAYKICQQSMLAPADLKDVTGGTYLSSKNAVQYFLDNEVSAESLASIPGLNAETVRASLQSVAPVVEEVVAETPVETVTPGEKRAEEVVEAITPILKEAGILDVLDNVELNPDGSLNRDSLHAELASMTPSESEETFDPASYFSNDRLRRRMERRAERNGQTLGEYLDDRAERKGVSAEEFVADKEEKIEKREAKRDAFVNGAREFFGL